MTRGWALVWGGLLVGAGALALLVNLGLVHPEQIYRVYLLWPLILILIGAEIVLARLAPRPVATITMSVVVLLVVAGTIGYVASAPPPQTVHRSFAATDSGTGPATLRVDLGAATIHLSAAGLSGQAAQVGFDYVGGVGGDPSFRWDPAARVLEVSRSESGFPFTLSAQDRVTVTLNVALRWRLELNTGASTVTADLSQARVDSYQENGGAITLHLQLGPASGTVRVNVNGGASRVDLSRPAGTPIHVDLEGGANSLTADGRGVGGTFGAIGWSSSGYPAPDQYVVTINGGANQVTVSQAA